MTSKKRKEKLAHIHTQIHAIEDELIQLNGLVKALQQILPDGNAHICVTNALEDRLECLQKHFYEHWKTLTNK